MLGGRAQERRSPVGSYVFQWMRTQNCFGHQITSTLVRRLPLGLTSENGSEPVILSISCVESLGGPKAWSV